MKLQWRLDELFKSDDDCYSAFEEIDRLLNEIYKYKDDSLDEDMLLEMLDKCFEIKNLSYKCLVYGSLRYYQDVNNDETNKLKNEVERLNNKVVGSLAFIDGMVLNKGREIIFSFIKNNGGLDKYRVYLDNLFRTEKHNIENSRITTLKDEINVLIGEYNETLKSVQLDSIEVDGKEIELSIGSVPKFLAASSRETRKQAFLSLNKGYSLRKDEVARILNEIVKRRVEISRIRDYESPLDEALDEENISPKIVSELIKIVDSNKKLLQKYMMMQAKFYGITEPHLYDLGRTFVTDNSRSFGRWNRYFEGSI